LRRDAAASGQSGWTEPFQGLLNVNTANVELNLNIKESRLGSAATFADCADVLIIWAFIP
jgi:hypothetical protein